MTKSEINAVITFAFAAAFFDFFTMNTATVYPRDRIIHTIISLCFAIFFVLFLQMINTEKIIIRLIGQLFVLARFVSVTIKALGYYTTFHGDNTLGILILACSLIVLLKQVDADKLHVSYVYFVAVNVLMFFLILLLSFNRLSVVNIYSNSTGFNFSLNKLFFFSDIFVVMLVTNDKKQRVCIQLKYILFTTAAIVFVTILQGLCISGNLLYSISPLQSLMQIFTGETIKRYDYIISIMMTMNYFAAVILYICVFKSIHLRKSGKKSELP